MHFAYHKIMVSLELIFHWWKKIKVQFAVDYNCQQHWERDHNVNDATPAYSWILTDCVIYFFVIWGHILIIYILISSTVLNCFPLIFIYFCKCHHFHSKEVSKALLIDNVYTQFIVFCFWNEQLLEAFAKKHLKLLKELLSYASLELKYCLMF